MNDIAARFAERLSKIQGGGPKVLNVRPRDAATMIIIDRAAPPPQVLLGRRHHGHKFMPGKFVFPGGRVEPLDRRMASATQIAPQVEARLMQNVRRPSREKVRGFVLAAIRETFEETGILLGAKNGDMGGDGGALAQRPRGTGSSRPASCRTSRPCTSSPAPSRRPARRNASTRASSQSMPTEIAVRLDGVCRARHRAHRVRLASDRCRRRGSTCRRSPLRCSRSWRRASRPGPRTTRRCRSIAW